MQCSLEECDVQVPLKVDGRGGRRYCSPEHTHEGGLRKMREWRRSNPDTRGYRPIGKVAQLRNYLKYKYGISMEEYDSLLAKQKGACAICHSTETPYGRLYVDHDHETGRVRGLLCHHCNFGLGHFKDSEEALRNALDYLHS